MFTPKRHFRELLQSEEAISTNVLAERLNSLVEAGLLWKAEDPTHKQKAVYRLTGAGQDLLPVLAALGSWGAEHLPGTDGLPFSRASDGSPKLKAIREQIRASHSPPQAAASGAPAHQLAQPQRRQQKPRRQDGPAGQRAGVRRRKQQPARADE